MKNKNYFFVALGGIILGGILFGLFSDVFRGKESNPTITTTPMVQTGTESTSTPSVTDTKDWPTFSSGTLTFQYPSTLTPVERQNNYVVLLNDSKNPQSVLISIDGRMSQDYTDYTKAVESAKASLDDVQVTPINSGTKISGKLGPGLGQGQPVTEVILNYNGAAIVIETPSIKPEDLKVFDQVVSSFIFPIK